MGVLPPVSAHTRHSAQPPSAPAKIGPRKVRALPLGVVVDVVFTINNVFSQSFEILHWFIIHQKKYDLMWGGNLGEPPFPFGGDFFRFFIEKMKVLRSA